MQNLWEVMAVGQQQQHQQQGGSLNNGSGSNNGRHGRLEWARRDSEERARHRTDFEILTTVGRGGFGTVYRVRNNIDSHIYALKTVKIGNNSNNADDSSVSDSADKVLREVQVLSSVNHPNVVRYFGAWVEKSWLQQDQEEEGGFEDDPTTLSSATITGTSSNVDDEQRQPTCHLCSESYADWEVSFEHWGLIDAALQPVNLCVACYKRSLPSHVDPTAVNIRPSRRIGPPDHLFILMEYCDRTLLEAVREVHNDNSNDDDDGNNNDALLWSYFAQCCRGLEHLHSKGIAHRDVKPTNVFVSGDKKDDGGAVVKIGDLGLARRLEVFAASGGDGEQQRQPQHTFSGEDSPEVGTFLYMAPECKRTGRRRNSNNGDGTGTDTSGDLSTAAAATAPPTTACDVYSLGVLLVEIWSSFGTAMERVKVLSAIAPADADNGGPVLPPELESRYPTQAQLAKRMVAGDPSQRPTCSQILVELKQAGLYKQQQHQQHQQQPSQSTSSCCTDLLEGQVETLRGELESKQREVCLLRRLLDEHGIPHDHI